MSEIVREFMQNEPMVFAFSQSPENRNFLKWAIDENIKYSKMMLKQIAKLEKKYDLPTETLPCPRAKKSIFVYCAFLQLYRLPF